MIALDFADIHTLSPRACNPHASGVYISKIPCSSILAILQFYIDYINPLIVYINLYI